MKKWKSIVAISAVCSMLATGSASAAAQSEIKVMLNGSPLSFQKAPFISEGTTLVPFRALFEALGLTVEWKEETRTIVGVGEGLELQLQLDNKAAIVNGEELTLSVAPRSINGQTFVPLRFVGEATNRVVNWSDETRTITIEEALDAVVEVDFEAWYNGFNEASKNEDVEAVMAYFHTDSPLKEPVQAVLGETFAKFDVVSEVQMLEVLDTKADEVTLHVVETNVNTNDRFHTDHELEGLFTLKPDADGEWKIYNFQITNLNYIVPEEAYTTEAEVDAATKAAIEEAIESSLVATEEEDMEAVLGSIDETSPAYAMTSQSMEFLFTTYDLDYETELVNIIEVYEEEATVYTVQTMTKVDGPEFTDSRVKAVQVLKKQEDGTWKIYSVTPVSIEPLQ